MPVEAARLLEIAMEVVEPAAELAVTMRTEAIRDVSTKSTRTDVVTAADRAVERYVIEELHRLRPGDAILGEELGECPASAAGGQRVRWILDPIDGTVNYLYGIPMYGISLAAEVDGVVVAGVVRNAASGEVWSAVRGGGAYRGGKRLSGSPVTELGQSLIGTGFGYDARRRVHQAQVVAKLLPMVRDIRRLGAASIDLCLAAEGRLDGYFEKGLNLWDYAAGGLVASEAGLTVSGLVGVPHGAELIIAAPSGIYQRLHDTLVELDAAGGP
jgi:myo-inositol-1(or 4)-monophosphatase